MSFTRVVNGDTIVRVWKKIKKNFDKLIGTEIIEERAQIDEDQ